MLTKIISGGQTGVDTSALVVARSLGITTGGYAPLGYMTERGKAPYLGRVYGLIEVPTMDYPARRRENIRNSDCTLVLTFGPAMGGTWSTVKEARIYNRDPLVVNLALGSNPCKVTREATIKHIYDSMDILANVVAKGAEHINIAGPRLSKLDRDKVNSVEKYLRLAFTHLAKAGLVNVPDRSEVLSDLSGEVGDRIGTRWVCPICDREALDHPQDATRLSNDGSPFLHVMCDGRIVKL